MYLPWHTSLYTETPRYGHFRNRITLLLRPLFLGRLTKTAILFLVKKTLINTANLLTQPIFFGPLVTVLTGFHCIVIRLTLTSMEHLVWIRNTCYDSLRERWSTMLKILSQIMKEGKLRYVRYCFTLYSSRQVFCCYEPCWYKQTLH